MLWGNPDCTIPSHIGRASQRGKDPRPNCIVSEFFVRFWHIVGQGYFNTIKDSIVVGKFSKGVTKEVITLIFKTGDKRWVRELVPHLILERSLQELCQSIVTVKIYAKALHCHLQPLLMEVINSDHYAFLPLKVCIRQCIFDTRDYWQGEMLQARLNSPQAWVCKQGYHGVCLGISILTHEEDGVVTEFVDMVKLFFQDVESCRSPQM